LWLQAAEVPRFGNGHLAQGVKLPLESRDNDVIAASEGSWLRGTAVPYNSQGGTSPLNGLRPNGNEANLSRRHAKEEFIVQRGVVPITGKTGGEEDGGGSARVCSCVAGLRNRNGEQDLLKLWRIEWCGRCGNSEVQWINVVGAT
jgi:hypothetical protein